MHKDKKDEKRELNWDSIWRYVGMIFYVLLYVAVPVTIFVMNGIYKKESVCQDDFGIREWLYVYACYSLIDSFVIVFIQLGRETCLYNQYLFRCVICPITILFCFSWMIVAFTGTNCRDNEPERIKQLFDACFILNVLGFVIFSACKGAYMYIGDDDKKP